MKLLKLFKALAWAISIGFIAFCVLQGIAEGYADSLKATGGMVTAKDLMEVQIFPWCGAIIIGIIILYFNIAKSD